MNIILKFILVRSWANLKLIAGVIATLILAAMIIVVGVVTASIVSGLALWSISFHQLFEFQKSWGFGWLDLGASGFLFLILCGVVGGLVKEIVEGLQATVWSYRRFKKEHGQ